VLDLVLSLGKWVANDGDPEATPDRLECGAVTGQEAERRIEAVGDGVLAKPIGCIALWVDGDGQKLNAIAQRLGETLVRGDESAQCHWASIWAGGVGESHHEQVAFESIEGNEPTVLVEELESGGWSPI
jgi:hypothetical protein